MLQSSSHRQDPIPSRTINRTTGDQKSSGGSVAGGEVGGVDVVVGQVAVRPPWTLIDRLCDSDYHVG